MDFKICPIKGCFDLSNKLITTNTKMLFSRKKVKFNIMYVLCKKHKGK